MKKALLYSGLVLLILVLLTFSVSLFLVMSTSSRVARQRAAISAAGEPLLLTDLTQEPIPDEENACFHLMRAKADFAAFEHQYGQLNELDLTRRLRPDQVNELARLVEHFSQHSRVYEAIEKAAACSQSDAKVDYAQGIAAELPHVTVFRSAARASQANALLAAYRGEGDEALAHCERAVRLTAHLQGEPLLISHLVDIACQAIAVQCANHVLRVAETSPPALEALDAALAAIDNRRARVDALEGERAMGVLTFAQLRSGKLDPAAIDNGSSPLRYLSSSWIGQAYLNDDESKYLELMESHIQAAKTSGSERQALLDLVEDELKASGTRHMLTRLLLPALHAALVASERGDTLNHCLQMLLALQGSQTATLADLGLPDPVTRDAQGLPLVFHHTLDGWIVYGLGGNGIDDGGKTSWEDGDPLDLGLAPLLDPLPAERDELIGDEDVRAN